MKSGNIVYSTHPVEPEIEATETEAVPAEKRGGAVKIFCEKRSSGKTVTLIKDLPCSKQELAQLFKTLKKKCAAGGTIKDDVVELQGDQKKKAAAELLAMGYKVKGA